MAGVSDCDISGDGLVRDGDGDMVQRCMRWRMAVCVCYAGGCTVSFCSVQPRCVLPSAPRCGSEPSLLPSCRPLHQQLLEVNSETAASGAATDSRFCSQPGRAGLAGLSGDGSTPGSLSALPSLGCFDAATRNCRPRTCPTMTTAPTAPSQQSIRSPSAHANARRFHGDCLSSTVRTAVA